MLKLSPIFGAIFATIIMLLYASIKAEINIAELGAILKVLPPTFIVTIIISYILFIPIKIIFLREQSKTKFKEMWKVFFVMIFSIILTSFFGALNYFFEKDIVKAITIVVAFSLDMIFSYSFYVSLEKQLAKNNIQK